MRKGCGLGLGYFGLSDLICVAGGKSQCRWRVLSPQSPRVFANRLSLNSQGAMKNEEDQHQLQDRHCAPLWENVGVSSSIGITQPSGGTRDPDRRRRSMLLLRHPLRLGKDFQDPEQNIEAGALFEEGIGENTGRDLVS